VKWLVTGAYGFIGANFVRMLVKKGEEVIGVDCETYAAEPKNLEGLGVNVYKLDISQREDMEMMFGEFGHQDFKDIDIVVNFAAESHVDRSINSSAPFIQSNIVGVSVLLDLAVKYGFKFVQVSTDEVYGSVEQQNGLPFTEDMALYPNSPYSASKASADLLVLSYVHTHKIDATITRCSNNYGPYQNPEKMMPKCIIHSFTGQDIPLYGDGLNVRDWIYVEDHCRGIYLASIFEHSKGQVYNFGGNHPITNKDLVSQIIEQAQGSEDQVKMVEDRKGHDRTYKVSFIKAIDELGWEPKVTFKEGLQKTIRWYAENYKWWQYKKDDNGNPLFPSSAVYKEKINDICNL
jgi:dTDP-glucose 4,6-dehydratase